MYIFKNRSGVEYEVSEEQREKLIDNGDAKESSFIAVKKEENEPTQEQVLRAEYKLKFGKGVPINKSKDVEWMKEQLLVNTN